MGSLTNYGETALVGHLCGSSYTSPANVYLALCTADPTDAATGASMNEVANANGYARQAISFGAPSARRVTQDAVVNFPAATGAWGTASHWAIVDSATYGAGNALAYGALGSSKVIVNGNTPSVPSADVYVEISASAGGSGWTTFLVHELLDHTFNNAAYTQPATYLGLTTTTSSDSAGGTEASGGSYARVLINKAGGASPAWAAVSGGATSLNQQTDFTVATGSWGTVVSSAIYDASTAGNMLMYDNNTTDQAVGDGDTWRYAAGEWDVSLT